MPMPSHEEDALWAMKHIDGALAKGWLISVNDGEEWTLRKSGDRDAIVAEICTTDENLIGFWADGVHIGNVYWIFGEPNGDGIFTNSSGSAEFSAWLDTISKERTYVANTPTPKSGG